jgi:glycerol uptake facilitator-like aquaporin
MRLIWLALVTALLAGCGGGGGGGAAGNAGEPGTVTVVLSTQAASAATVIYGVELTLHLPAGVTLPADPVSGLVSGGLLHPAVTADVAVARYLPAAAGVQASAKVNIAQATGFAVGGLATLTCSVAPGASANGADFSLDGFSARDANGAVIPGITPHLTVRTP